MITCIPLVQPYKTVMLLFLFNSVVVNILQKDMFPQDVDTEIRRGCYAICLQLARFVFFWILELHSVIHVVVKFCLKLFKLVSTRILVSIDHGIVPKNHYLIAFWQ